MKFVVSSIALVLICLLIEQPVAVGSEPSDQAHQIRVDEIGRSVTLIGRLGRPLGMKMEITGKWVSEAKGAPLLFSVTHVDGEKLDNPRNLSRPVNFYSGQVYATTEEMSDKRRHDAFRDNGRVGEEWTMIAYETGYIDLTPADLDEKERFISSRAPWSRVFTSQLVGVLIVKSKSINKNRSVKKVGDDSKENHQIRVDEIGRSVTLIGRLGRPLGMKMQIRGTWAANEMKGETPLLSITHVEGEKLDAPVGFSKSQVGVRTNGYLYRAGAPLSKIEILDEVDAYAGYKSASSLIGEEWTLTAYETGYAWLTPKEFKDAQDESDTSNALWSRGFTSVIEAGLISKKKDDK